MKRFALYAAVVLVFGSLAVAISVSSLNDADIYSVTKENFRFSDFTAAMVRAEIDDSPFKIMREKLLTWFPPGTDVTHLMVFLENAAAAESDGPGSVESRRHFGYAIDGDRDFAVGQYDFKLKLVSVFVMGGRIPGLSKDEILGFLWGRAISLLSDHTYLLKADLDDGKITDVTVTMSSSAL